MAIGARWDDRITGKLSEFCVGATKIHVDIDVAEFNKIVKPDVCLAGDARLSIEDLLPLVSKLDTADWLKQIGEWRKQYPLKYLKKGGLRAQHVLDRLDKLGGREFFENRLSGVDLEGNPDFVKLAQAYGIKAFRIKRPSEVDRILKAAHAYDEGPVLVEAEVIKEDNVFPMIPAGAPLRDMIIDRPKHKMAKPEGST
jgi:thiamine pyrophosphate-dependent acetolactate synthase large subunit-like protein